MNPNFLEILLKIGDLQLLQTYLQTTKRTYGNNDVPSFCVVLDKCLARFGWGSLIPSLLTFTKELSLDGTVAFLEHFTSFKINDKKAQEMLTNIARDLINVKINSKTLTLKDLCDLAQVANTLDPTLFAKLFKYIQRFKHVDTELIPLLKQLYERVPSIAQREEFIKLAKKCITTLEKRITTARARPDNWSVLAEYDCKCADCKPVAIFLKNPTEREYRYKALQKNRRHIEDKLGYRFSGLLKLATDTRGSPQTLVVTKVGKESEAAKNSADKDEVTIAVLKSLLDGSSSQRANKRQKVLHVQ
jgi:hypothetical protein